MRSQQSPPNSFFYLVSEHLIYNKHIIKDMFVYKQKLKELQLLLKFAA